MDNSKYYQQVEKPDLDRIKSEFEKTVEASTVYRFVNMYMLCIEDESAIKEIMLTEDEIKELREIFMPKSKNPMFGRSSWHGPTHPYAPTGPDGSDFRVYFEYNAIKDVNQGRLEAGIAKGLVEATKSQFEENNYIQLVREGMYRTLYRTLGQPEMHSCCYCTKNLTFKILKMPDEWFWIELRITPVMREYTESYFKCDGFFGLKKLIENIINE